MLEVWAIMVERLQVRLDPQRRAKLRELAEARGTTVSEVMRQLIDEAHELRERRKGAARALAAMEIEDVPDPETVGRQLAEAHDPGVP